MNLLVISRHDDLIDRLRLAFEASGHRILRAEDPLEALAQDDWGEANILLVDSSGDPMDGYHLCRLLRGEARVLFRNIPIFLILDHTPTEQDLAALRQAEGDGFILAASTIQQLHNYLDAVLAGAGSRREGARVPLLAVGLQAGLAQTAQELLGPCGMKVHPAGVPGIAEALRDLKAPVLLLGLAGGGVEGALATLARLKDRGRLPYVILVGQVRGESAQVRLLEAGISDWVPLPLIGPRLVHACRRAMEWMHIQRIQAEYESAIHDLRERRSLLEVEAAGLRNEVLTDPLTDLLNRRAFDQNLEHAVRQWERHRRSFVLLMADVDHFKLINDRFGHPVGDQVLRHLAATLRTALRKSDLAFRIGGEEFAILLSETNPKAGAEVANKLRSRIDENPIVLPTGQTIFPTVSFGVGGPGAPTAAELVAQVDRALYQAKSLGRNRVVLAGTGDQPPRALSAGS